MRDWIGQTIHFQAEFDPDQQYATFKWVTAKKGDTASRIAARLNAPSFAETIRALNGLRSTATVIPTGKRIKLPGKPEPPAQLDVYAGDRAPVIKDGYGLFEVIAVPGRTGLTKFSGYNPLMMDVPVRFESFIVGNSRQVEADIAALEELAGRGHYAGAAIGPPAVVSVMAYDNTGNWMNLTHPSLGSGKWRIGAPSGSGIEWNDDAVLDDFGSRLRQTATVHLMQYTPVSLLPASAAARSKQSGGVLNAGPAGAPRGGGGG